MAQHKLLVNCYHDHQLVGPTPPAKTDNAEVSDEMAKIFAEAGVIKHVGDQPKKKQKVADYSAAPSEPE
jgi:hypothetical protein